MSTTLITALGPTRAVAATTDPAADLAVEPCPAGAELELPASSQLTSDGWIVMTYDLDGMIAYRELPPIGFDPVTASDAVLALHHMPTRPTGGTGLAEWSQMVRSQRIRAKNMCGIPSISHSGSWRYSQNWAGDEVKSGAYSFVGAQSHFIQMGWNGSCGSSAALSQWVGVGGDTEDVFVQAGTDTLSDGSYAWWELPPAPTQVINVPVAATNSITAIVTVDHQGSHFTIYNNTTGVWDYAWTAQDQSDVFNSAEWIDERPTVNKSLPPLMDFYNTYWTSMWALQTNDMSWHTAFSQSTEWWIKMLSNDGKTTLAQTTGTYSDDHMDDYWYNCGP